DLQFVGEPVGEAEGCGAIEGAQLLVFGGNRGVHAEPVLIDVLQRDVERELSGDRSIERVQIEWTRGRAAARVEAQRGECEKQETASHAMSPSRKRKQTNEKGRAQARGGRSMAKGAPSRTGVATRWPLAAGRWPSITPIVAASSISGASGAAADFSPQ